MFLKKIVIVGFKSFARKTVLDFSEAGIFGLKKNIGITAVVGPNGSGKSNIADALRWALGEQSMKNLRSKKSQDIIFAGSDKKAQLGSAQVSIFLDNSKKKVPIDYEEVIITRKIYRSGESEYLINGSKSRLIDVVDLLAKGGVGQRSYCIINQGMADQVLSASLTERRAIIEEAAGVKEYQIKKERSERKLRNTKINLERARGLLVEIEPHLKMLKNQSRKAQKGEEYRRELKEKQERLFGYLWNKFSDEEARATEGSQIFAKEVMISQREIDEAREKIIKESESVGNFQEKIKKKEEEIRKMNYQSSNLERDILVKEGMLALEREKEKALPLVEVISVGVEYTKRSLSEIRILQKKLLQEIDLAKEIKDIEKIKKIAMPIYEDICKLEKGLEKGRIEKKKPDEIVEKRKKEFEERRKKIQQEIISLSKERQDLVGKIEKTKKEVDDLLRIDREERKNILKWEDFSRRKQFEIEKLKERLGEAKMELARTGVRKEDLGKRIRLEMKIEPEKLVYQKKERENVEELEGDIFKIKSRLEQIGAIDESVLEEYEETQKRYDFLGKESRDLDEAMKSLKKVIREMDGEIKGKFELAFKRVDEKFGEYFKLIFSGGKAGLRKIKIKISGEGFDENKEDQEENLKEKGEDENENQMGIDIVAIPPGKKITSLGMLSGGERTLTSLALLFAIISFNPPPFAILDEVEASLDEANSKRFGKILRQLSGKTQFVLVTHNRQIMREAVFLYGVSMNDDGTSQLLSVKLDQIGEKGKIKFKDLKKNEDVNYKI